MSLSDNYQPDFDNRWSQQESGITGTHSTPTEPYFGPATRQEYDPSEWAMTATRTTHEIYLDPANPQDRMRKAGEPTFFKPSENGYHLGPALAILHSIPAAREALIMPNTVLEDYGHNERWWSGEAIETSRITTVIEGDAPDKKQPSEVIVEVQRLMAFLDNTIRGYGSVDSLAKMRSVYEEQQGCMPPHHHHPHIGATLTAHSSTRLVL